MVSDDVGMVIPILSEVIVRSFLLASLKNAALAVSGHGLGRVKFIRATYEFFFKAFKPNRTRVQGHWMWLDEKDTLELATREIYEPMETAFLKKNLAAGQTFLDIGANIGYYTLLAARQVGPKGKVIAFEPDPDNFGLLKKNVQENGYTYVRLVQKAVSDRAIRSRLFLSESNKGDHRIFDSKDGRPSIPISSIRLDAFLKRMDRKVHFIKMDIQGAESKALAGMTSLIRKNERLILVTEFCPAGLKRAGASAQKYFLALKRLGFRVFEVSEAQKKVFPADLSDILRRCTLDNDGYTNLACLKKISPKV